ncbi:7 transmembrane receptor (rhodopsin family) domain-containing protein [Ditylenchus destructor]|uniref:7 transmembrane receptor (Rhodopsin family) domain-containing protein n=1 Tax=Ditylenchus destructor TaxID=166010 RepID=A0AAD4N153_9BILA|nr:7 transmembrane receptor (rhodopsin family) domain-containing protein [Ditylenchus destructor]
MPLNQTFALATRKAAIFLTTTQSAKLYVNGDEWNSPYHPLFQIVGWIVALILSLETIIGNAMVVVAYRIERSINKQVNNRFIVSLAISDMIIGLEGIPLFTVYVINGDRWPLGSIACETWLFLDYTLCLVSILTVLLITADRYMSVCHTAKYLKWQNPVRIQLLIGLSWIIPALIFGVMIYGWAYISGEGVEEVRKASSNGECYAPFLSNPYVNMSMYVAYYWTTLIAMLILYKGIHKAAKKLETKAKAKEHRHIALLLTQRLGTQVGVSLMLHSQRQQELAKERADAEVRVKIEKTKDSGYATNNTLSTTFLDSSTGITDSRRSSVFPAFRQASSPLFRHKTISQAKATLSKNLNRTGFGRRRSHNIAKPQNSLPLEGSPELPHRNGTINSRAGQLAVPTVEETLQEKSKEEESDEPEQKIDNIDVIHEALSRQITPDKDVRYQDPQSSVLQFKRTIGNPLDSPADPARSSTSSSTIFANRLSEKSQLSNSFKFRRHSYVSVKAKSNHMPSNLSPTSGIPDENHALLVPETQESHSSTMLPQEKRRKSHRPSSASHNSIPLLSLQDTEHVQRRHKNCDGENARKVTRSSRSFSTSSSISDSVSETGSLKHRPRPQGLQAAIIPLVTITRESINCSNDDQRLSVEGEERTHVSDGRRGSHLASPTEIGRKLSSFTKNTSDRFMQTLFTPISAFNKRRKRTKAEKRAHKAFRTITFIVGLFAILWSPYYVVATVYGFCKGECISPLIYNISYYMCYLNSSGNPFAYALANRQFRSAFTRMFKGNFKKSRVT